MGKGDIHIRHDADKRIVEVSREIGEVCLDEGKPIKVFEAVNKIFYDGAFPDLKALLSHMRPQEIFYDAGHVTVIGAGGGAGGSNAGGGGGCAG